VCSLNKQDLEAEFPFVGELSGAFADIDVGDPLTRTKATAAQLCFLSAYAFALLHHGHGFDLERNFTVVDTMEYGGSELKVRQMLYLLLLVVLLLITLLLFLLLLTLLLRCTDAFSPFFNLPNFALLHWPNLGVPNH